MKYIAFTLASLVLAPLTARADGLSLIPTADSLYGRAAKIVANVPTSRDESLALARPDGGAAGIFYAEERTFQDRVNALKSTDEITSHTAQTNFRLGQFDNFVYSSVLDAIMACSREQARLNLQVAHELLQELHRIRAGRGNAHWNPPDLGAADDARSGHCAGDLN